MKRYFRKEELLMFLTGFCFAIVLVFAAVAICLSTGQLRGPAPAPVDTADRCYIVQTDYPNCKEAR